MGIEEYCEAIQSRIRQMANWRIVKEFVLEFDGPPYWVTVGFYRQGLDVIQAADRLYDLEFGIFDFDDEEITFDQIMQNLR